MTHAFPTQLQQVLVDYLLNATWQIPLIVLAAWSALRLAKPRSRPISMAPSSRSNSTA